MDEPMEIEARDISGSSFRESDLSLTKFSDVNLEGATFENINLRKTSFSAVDLGGASFRCMNTGEDRPKEPVMFEDVELDDCQFHRCVFSGVKLSDCELEGMTIDGIRVTEMIKAYRRIERESGDSWLGRVLRR